MVRKKKKVKEFEIVAGEVTGISLVKESDYGSEHNFIKDRLTTKEREFLTEYEKRHNEENYKTSDISRLVSIHRRVFNPKRIKFTRGDDTNLNKITKQLLKLL
jgi:hypothetical protein